MIQAVATFLGGILVLFSGCLAVALLGMLNTEVKSRLEGMPQALLRLVIRLMPEEHRDDVQLELEGELWKFLHSAEAVPVTRLVRGTSFALGHLPRALKLRAVVAKERREARSAARAATRHQTLRLRAPFLARVLWRYVEFVEHFITRLIWVMDRTIVRVLDVATRLPSKIVAWAEVVVDSVARSAESVVRMPTVVARRSADVLEFVVDVQQVAAQLTAAAMKAGWRAVQAGRRLLGRLWRR